MTSQPVLTSDAATWLLRLATDPVRVTGLKDNPVAFSAWYALAGGLVDWPAEVVQIQQTERARPLSSARMMRRLSQASPSGHGHTRAEHARASLEGCAVHDWLSRHPQALPTLAHEALMRPALLHPPGDDDRFAQRLKELARLLGLSPLEQQILSFAFLTTMSKELCRLFEQLASDQWSVGKLWATVFATSEEALAAAMRARSPLRLCGLLQPTGRRTQLAAVSPFWVGLLSGAEPLADALLEPLDFRTGSGQPARLLPEDLRLAVTLLRHADRPGVNLLLYGDASLEKHPLLREMVSGAGRSPFRVRRLADAPRDVLPSLTLVAFHLLQARTDAPVLVIEQPANVLHTASSPLMRALFGVELPPGDSLPFDQNLLTGNPVPGVWVSSRIAALPDDTIARFLFHAPLKKADRSTQERTIRQHLSKLDLGKPALAEILTLAGISSAQLESAVSASQLLGTADKAGRDGAIVQALRRSQRALSRDLCARHRAPVTQYSLEYLNTAGRVSPRQILDSFRRQPRGSMLLYGLPGTGKTQLVEHMADELGMPLVARSASALLSKWLGESEKNIAAAFEEAAGEDAILFFEEGDSLLRRRDHATHSWEVTQTNELLQRMERFEGIVVVATNLFRHLDTAVLRRFTFKIELRELDASQRWRMFVSEAQLSERLGSIDGATLERWENRLLLMRHLTPGDFATVKRQSLLLNTELTPEEWLLQLELEC